MLLLLHLNIVPSPADAADAAASLFRPPTALTRLWVAVNVAIPPLLFFADWQKKLQTAVPSLQWPGTEECYIVLI